MNLNDTTVRMPLEIAGITSGTLNVGYVPPPVIGIMNNSGVPIVSLDADGLCTVSLGAEIPLLDGSVNIVQVRVRQVNLPEPADERECDRDSD